jgi:hypothetical protein
MTLESGDSTDNASAGDRGDQTLELQLTEAERLALSGAANLAEPRPTSAADDYARFASKRTKRMDFVTNLTLAVAGLGLAVALLWPASGHQLSMPAMVAIAAPQPPVTAPSPPPPEDPGPPVRIRNAFDKSEVFEFPNGTDDAQAREAVMQLLLDRARERRDAWLEARRLGTSKATRRSAMEEPAIFITKLVARTKDASSGTN